MKKLSMRTFQTLWALAVLAASPACLVQEKAGTPVNPAQVVLSWKALPGEQQGFLIEQSSDGGSFKQVQSVPEGTSTATVVGLFPGKTYHFRIRGFNQAGNSPYTAAVTATVPASH